jgi:hypothetical protein
MMCSLQLFLSDVDAGAAKGVVSTPNVASDDEEAQKGSVGGSSAGAAGLARPLRWRMKTPVAVLTRDLRAKLGPMRRAIGALFDIGLLGLIGAGVADVVKAPAPRKGQCLLARRLVLPDVCVNTCSPAFDCTRTTRPYLFVFRQAASCVDAVIC